MQFTMWQNHFPTVTWGKVIEDFHFPEVGKPPICPVVTVILCYWIPARSWPRSTLEGGSRIRSSDAAIILGYNGWIVSLDKRNFVALQNQPQTCVPRPFCFSWRFVLPNPFALSINVQRRFPSCTVSASPLEFQPITIIELFWIIHWNMSFSKSVCANPYATKVFCFHRAPKCLRQGPNRFPCLHGSMLLGSLNSPVWKECGSVCLVACLQQAGARLLRILLKDKLHAKCAVATWTWVRELSLWELSSNVCSSPLFHWLPNIFPVIRRPCESLSSISCRAILSEIWNWKAKGD